MSEAKKNSIEEISKFMTAEGISIADLTTFQGTQEETKSEAEIRPSQLEGVSNQPALSNEQLTSEVVELKRRFNNLNAAHYDGKF